MDAVLDFLRNVLSKLEVIIPTLITILGSCGGILIYKMTSILANVKVFRNKLKESDQVIAKLEALIEETIEGLKQRDEVVTYLANSSPNAIVKKKANAMINNFPKLESYRDKVLAVAAEQEVGKKKKTRKVKVKKAKSEIK